MLGWVFSERSAYCRSEESFTSWLKTEVFKILSSLNLTWSSTFVTPWLFKGPAWESWTRFFGLLWFPPIIINSLSLSTSYTHPEDWILKAYLGRDDICQILPCEILQWVVQYKIKGSIRIWTTDQMICTQMLYHWTILPMYQWAAV